MIRPNKDIVEQKGLKDTKINNAIKELEKVNINTLNNEQKNIYDVFIGKKDKIVLQGHDLNDLYSFEQGSRNAGAKKIMIKHAGVEKTGGLNNDELLNIMDVIRVGDINSDSFEQLSNKIRYAYTLEKNDVKLKVVVDEYNDGKKIFDYYSDRNFIDYNNKTKVDTDMDVISKNNKKGVENLLDAIDTSSDKVGLVKKVLLNKDISDGVKAKAVNRLTKNKISQATKNSYISTKNSDNN